MTYGVDECRRCGKSMPVGSPQDMARYVKSLMQKPTMTEEEWRAAGWKAMPTNYQMNRKLTGLCNECRMTLGTERTGETGILFWLGLMTFLVLGVISFILLHS